MRAIAPLFALALGGGCATPAPDTGVPAVDPGPTTFQFAFGVIADPHVTGEGEHADRLARTVEWFNDNGPERGVELVVVLGDIGWSGGLELSRDLLDGLDVPYAPVIGDNEVHAYEEAAFLDAFAQPLAELQQATEGWSQASDPTWNPDHDRESAFSNFGFDHRGVRFLSLDWASRSDDLLEGELGDLHDFEGGTWPWFESQITALAADRPTESVVMLSHIPMAMIVGGFDQTRADQLMGLTAAYEDLIWANFAGHWHIDVESWIADGGYEMVVTDAIWDDTITARVVSVSSNDLGFSYELEHLTID